MTTNGKKRIEQGGLSPDAKDVWRIFRIMSEFVEGFEEMSSIGPAVTIFGSARTLPSDPYYKTAEETARLLVKHKFSVITGGGPGIMEAANKGAFEAGGKSVGLNISLPQEQEANRYQTLSLDFHYFYARKVMFVKYASAFICFPGGYGTLDEFFETITLIQTLKVEAFPIILFGSEYWNGLEQWLRKQILPRYIDREDIDIFKIVDDPAEAVKLIVGGIKKHWWRPLDGELNKINHNGGKSRGPLSGAKSTETGEGTRYGKRPKRSQNKHAKPSRKPTQ
ncbi:MAG TPA: TIGR00730 family Rossman fold protein [Tepidisphaeraceae bacterium]|nr:TIGR00730 family Rossman fold protein [Tepidisphaeraceae bacterium]